MLFLSKLLWQDGEQRGWVQKRRKGAREPLCSSLVRVEVSEKALKPVICGSQTLFCQQDNCDANSSVPTALLDQYCCSLPSSDIVCHGFKHFQAGAAEQLSNRLPRVVFSPPTFCLCSRCCVMCYSYPPTTIKFISYWPFQVLPLLRSKWTQGQKGKEFRGPL